LWWWQGDAAFTCGISYEALNNVKAQTGRFIVVLNDNEWSIAKNVGAIAAYLNNIVTNPTYAHLHEKAGRFIKAIAGKGALHLAHKVEEGFKNLLVPVSFSKNSDCATTVRSMAMIFRSSLGLSNF
jgi:1-deoxy-D-xylulose-5-phosphate synthase